MPGDPQNSLFAGQHIVYDSLHKLFLVAQPFSSTALRAAAFSPMTRREILLNPWMG